MNIFERTYQGGYNDSRGMQLATTAGNRKRASLALFSGDGRHGSGTCAGAQTAWGGQKFGVRHEKVMQGVDVHCDGTSHF